MRGLDISSDYLHLIFFFPFPAEIEYDTVWGWAVIEGRKLSPFAFPLFYEQWDVSVMKGQL